MPEEHGSLYNKILEPYVNKGAKFLEIGVWRGVSLKAFKDYLKNADLYAIDSNTYSIEMATELGATIFNGDQSHKPFVESVAEKIGDLDIVIDDGGHWCDDQQVSFDSFWPIINKGGLYVIEDLWVADDRILSGYESTLSFLDKVDARKEYFKGTNGFEKDICVLYKN